MKELELWVPLARTLKLIALETFLFQREISSTFIVVQKFHLSLDIETRSPRGGLRACLLWGDSLRWPASPQGNLGLEEKPVPEAHAGCCSELRAHLSSR